MGKTVRKWASPIFGTILATAWKDWGKPRRTSGRIASLQSKIWTWDLLDTNQECFKHNAQSMDFKSVTLSMDLLSILIQKTPPYLVSNYQKFSCKWVKNAVFIRKQKKKLWRTYVHLPCGSSPSHHNQQWPSSSLMQLPLE
jgi:hypothetical protein